MFSIAYWLLTYYILSEIQAAFSVCETSGFWHSRTATGQPLGLVNFTIADDDDDDNDDDDNDV